MEEFSEEGLVARLEDHAKHFDHLLEFISVDVYYPQEITEEEYASRFTKNKKNQAPKLAVKQATKKAKKARLDPANYKTVPDVQREVLEEKLVEESEKKDATQKGLKRKREEEEQEEEPEPEPQNPLEVLGLVDPRPAVTPKPSRADLKELRDRLQERISELRARREAKNPDQAPPKKKQKKDKKEKKEKKKKKNKKENTEGAQPNGEESSTKSNKRKRSDSIDAESSHKKDDAATESEKSPKKQKKEANIKADVRYGALEFNKGTPLPESLAKKKKGMSKKQLLHKLEKEKDKQSKNGDKAALEKKEWDKLMAKAKGEKVKDNISLVKKSLKKEEKMKKKSKKEWKKREEDTKKRQEIKQKRRNANIAEYLAKKKDKRIAKRTGTKLKRPGFEGKKKKFLNK